MRDYATIVASVNIAFVLGVFVCERLFFSIVLSIETFEPTNW